MNNHVSTALAVAIIALVVWELAWKGIALWQAGNRHQLGWFVAILVINSVGLLPIVYLLINKNYQNGAAK